MTVTREDQATVDRFVRFTDPELDHEDVCLEVAAGVAEVSRTIARRVRHATALDASPERLAVGKREADREAIERWRTHDWPRLQNGRDASARPLSSSTKAD